MALDTGGNAKVDFVWGNVPMQPDDVRSGDGNPTVVSAANAAQNHGWSGYEVTDSPVLTKTAISKSLNYGISFNVPNNHSVVENNWNGYPDYTPVPPYTDTTDQAAVPNVVGLLEAAATTALTTAGFVKGAVTTTAVGATTVNDLKVKTQTPAADTVSNLGTPVALVKYLAPTVPNVVGLTEVAAESSLIAANLVKGAVTTDGAGATVANDGTVKSQTPTSGVKANTGSSVALVKYLAPTVPDVLGLTESAANDALVGVGLVKGAVTTSAVGATVANDGTVKAQTPTSGGKADSGSSVAITLFAAPTVPDVLGLTEVAAEAALVAANLVKGIVTESGDGATAENDGLVKSQTPVSGGKADTGSAVDLVKYKFAG